MPRFNFNNITLQSEADITKIAENFEEIEQNAAKLSDLLNLESTANKTTTINSESTNEEYPSALAVYNALKVKPFFNNIIPMFDVTGHGYNVLGEWSVTPSDAYNMLRDINPTLYTNSQQWVMSSAGQNYYEYTYFPYIGSVDSMDIIINCPVSIINPVIQIVYARVSNGVIYGYNVDTELWDSLISFSSTSVYSNPNESQFVIDNDNKYSKFKIQAAGTGNYKFSIMHFGINSGYIAQINYRG